MKISFSGNITLDFIVDEVKKTLDAEVYLSGYHQYTQDVFNPGSEFYRFSPDFSFFILDGNTLFHGRSLEEVKSEIIALFQAYQERDGNNFIVSSVVLVPEVDRILSYNSKINLKRVQNEFNLFLNSMADQHQSFYVLDVASIIEREGYRNIYDSALWVYGRVRYNKSGNKLLAKACTMLIRAILNKAQKCLVLDLDNTLWGGVIGEDGLSGISLGQDNIGSIYTALQRTILQIKDKGVILAVCSRNNQIDVQEVFSHHPGMLLKWDDFVIKKINWQAKDQNIHEIAHELNIGEDSLVFLDDSKFEREIVRANTMAVVPEFPDHPEEIPEFMGRVDEEYFSKIRITSEDREKTDQYLANFKREELRQAFSNLEDYVRTLDISLTIMRGRTEQAPRIAQLTQKTNQFNLTTPRYSEIEINRLLSDPAADIFVGSVEDKFGAYGLVLLMILFRKGDTAEIDTFLMSCRTIGRFIEDVFLEQIKKVLASAGVQQLNARYIPTQKNVLVCDKYEKMGFALVGVSKEGVKTYTISTNWTRNDLDLMTVKYEN